MARIAYSVLFWLAFVLPGMVAAWIGWVMAGGVGVVVGGIVGGALTVGLLSSSERVAADDSDDDGEGWAW